jgi:hypothetical protein
LRRLTGPPQDGQRHRTLIGGLQEYLGLALAWKGPGDVESLADAGDPRRRRDRERFADYRAEPLRRAGRVGKLRIGRDQPKLGRTAGDRRSEKQQLGALLELRGLALGIAGQVDDVAEASRNGARRAEQCHHVRLDVEPRIARAQARRLRVLDGSRVRDPDMGGEGRCEAEVGKIGISRRRRPRITRGRGGGAEQQRQEQSGKTSHRPTVPPP